MQSCTLCDIRRCYGTCVLFKSINQICCWRLGESCSCAVRDDVSLRGEGERDGA